MSENGDLTTKQVRAVVALLSSKTVQEAANTVNVSGRTMSRWLSDPAFRFALKQAECELLAETSRRLLSMAHTALTTIELTLTGSETTDTLKLRAAVAVLDHLARIREESELEDRIAALEAVLYGS